MERHFFSEKSDISYSSAFKLGYVRSDARYLRTENCTLSAKERRRVERNERIKQASSKVLLADQFKELTRICGGSYL